MIHTYLIHLAETVSLFSYVACVVFLLLISSGDRKYSWAYLVLGILMLCALFAALPQLCAELP